MSDQLSVLSEDSDPEAYLQKYILDAPFEDADKRLKVFETLKGINLEKEKELKLGKIRIDRDSYLQASDKTMLPDYPLSSEDKKNWRKYREYLRDFPANYLDNRLDHTGPLSYELWINWIESIRHKAGFNNFIP